MSVSREEFDALAARVTNLESLAERTWSIIGHLDTSLRELTTKVDAGFDTVDTKLDIIIRRLGDAS